YMQALEFPWTF
nr:immunoglobulin light chain junction region [Macaca mulatta]MOW41176.1 immunoglobulin light chain junction region [Macaca mulatta]MOW54004.1 immunoglobulin light chain junction region [Macaca mulatta]MOW55587.1 immunoglobulin light chain junction region [Macaca mulatta]MOW55996.1 immunoglobulin light chain junction region [Macaca mulatta]